MSHWKGYGTIGLARYEVPCHEVDREVKICAPERQRLSYRRLTKWIIAGALAENRRRTLESPDWGREQRRRAL